MNKAQEFIDIIEAKEFRAIVFLKDGKKVEMKAKKVGSRWEVGGDKPNALTDMGAKIFIEKDDGVFLLKGSRLIFQDNKGVFDDE